MLHIYNRLDETTVSITVSYKSCRRQRYLSLNADDNCKEVLVSMDAVYHLDNAGYWETEFEWSFADTMLSANFVSFKTKLTDWKEKHARNIFMQAKEWNFMWADQPVARNLMSMVVSENNVGDSASSLLLVRVLADPKAIMNSNYKVG